MSTQQSTEMHREQTLIRRRVVTPGVYLLSPCIWYNAYLLLGCWPCDGFGSWRLNGGPQTDACEVIKLHIV